MTVSRISTAKVFMAQILYHFIECTWGGCYNALYTNVLIPHLDAPDMPVSVLTICTFRLTGDGADENFAPCRANCAWNIAGRSIT